MKKPPLRAMTVAGMMSGTSADGVDTALVRIEPARAGLNLSLIAHRGSPFPPAMREAVLRAQDAQQTSVAALGKLHWRLGLAYAKAYRETLRRHPAQVELVGCHGQTIYHQGARAPFLGERFACTWQIGEMAPLAREAGVPVISNFRAADMVAGGQGAPLVPLLDVTLYREPRRARLLLNLGGVANITRIHGKEPALAFDTGPANMVVDALMQKLFDQPYDRGGAKAAEGAVLEEVVRTWLRLPFFKLRPPRSAGREQFGPVFAREFLASCRKHSRVKADAIATATALTARSIHDAVLRFASVPNGGEMIVAGGGARNATLLGMLREDFMPEGVRVLTTDDPALPVPLPVDAKEAVAFALLAYMSFHGRPGNVRSATGAVTDAVLGQVTCG